MSRYIRIFIINIVLCLNAGFVLASASNYGKLSIMAEVEPDARNKINIAFQTEAVKSFLPSTVKLSRYPKSAYHISICNFDVLKGDKAFGESEVKYLSDVVKSYINSPMRHQGAYQAECYDIQLWCHAKK